MCRFLPLQKTLRANAGPGGRSQRGITLLQLTLMLAAVMALVVGLSYKTSDFFAKSQVLDSDALLRLADNQLRQFVVANGRLPCPDLNGDGAEDYDDTSNACKTGGGAAQQKGYLPYLTLGMVEKNYVYGEVPILYGVYNDGNDVDGSGNSTGKVNLVSKTQVFFPTYADKGNDPTKITNTRNIFDFCASLGTLEARGGTVDSTGLSVAGQYTAVFALALPGQANRDGQPAGWAGGPSINAQYDGLNATSANQFELPQKQVSPSYDDRTAFRAAADMSDYLRCEAMNNSIGLLTEAVTMQQEVEDFADANDESATMGIVLNAVGIALATWEVIQDIAAISEASEQLGIASGLLATASATCPIPPWVTCALIPVYATAVTSASIGLGLSIGAAVSAGVGLGLEIAATIYYADVKARTTRPSPVYNQSTTPTDTGITADRLTKLKDNYTTSKAAAATAYAAVPAAPASSPTQLDTAQQAAGTGVANDIAQVTSQNGTLGSLLSDILNGSSVVCASPYTGCTSTQVPVLNSGSPAAYQKVNTDGTTSTCDPAAHTPSTWCADNGYSQTQMSIVWTKINSDGTFSTCKEADHPAGYCQTNGYTVANGYSAAGQPVYSTVYVRDGLTASYSPGVIPSVSSYYQALGPTQTQNPDGSVTVTPAPSGNVAGTLSTSNTVVHNFNSLLADIYDFDVKNLAYQAALDWEATKLSDYNYWSNLVSHDLYCYNNPLDAGNGCTSQTQAQWLSDYNAHLPSYNSALSAYNTAVTDRVAAGNARTTSLGILNTAMGISWTPPVGGHASLCGGGSTTGCGWMVGSPSGDVGSQARTASGDVNAYLSAYETYRNTDAYTAAKKAAASAAASAWSDRNSLKSAACTVNGSSWVGDGFTDTTNPDPNVWDAYWGSPLNPLADGRDGNSLNTVAWSPATGVATSVTITGGALKCGGGLSNADLQAKYCTVGSPTYNVDACKQYSTPATSILTPAIIQDPAGIVNILIQKGIAQ